MFPKVIFSILAVFLPFLAVETLGSLKELESAKQRLQENELRVQEFERRHQELLEYIKEENGRLMNVTSFLEVLRRTSRTSTRDVRAPTRGLKQDTDASIQEVQTDIDREEEKTLQVEDTLEEVGRLRPLFPKINLARERIRTHLKVGRQ